MGGWLKRFPKTYPVAVDNIRINRRCRKLYLLHSAWHVHLENYGTRVAKVVLNYSDGNTRELDINAGEQVADWWFPLYSTGLNPAFHRFAHGTDRAWTGTNPLIEKWAPDRSLVLFKTVFENPQPELKLDSISYVSSETMSCPFMVGLTVE
jgi:hypothetical protein